MASNAIFACTSGATQEVSDPGGIYSVTAGTASSHNIYVSGGNVILQNNRASSRTYYVIFFGTSVSF